MKRDVVVLLSDILKSLHNIELYTKEIDKEQFFKDEKTQDAVIRRLGVMGEAVKNIPSSFKTKTPQIEWKKIAGMRDILIPEKWVHTPQLAAKFNSHFWE